MKQRLLADFNMKNEKIRELQMSEAKAGEKYAGQHEGYQQEIQRLRGQLDEVRGQKAEAFTRLASLRAEVEGKSPSERKLREGQIAQFLAQSTSKPLDSLQSRSPVPNSYSSNYFPKIKSSRYT
jgi:ATP-dependent Clp protease ATP-binding subunit ClpA